MLRDSLNAKVLHDRLQSHIQALISCLILYFYLKSFLHSLPSFEVHSSTILLAFLKSVIGRFLVSIFEQLMLLVLISRSHRLKLPFFMRFIWIDFIDKNLQSLSLCVTSQHHAFWLLFLVYLLRPLTHSSVTSSAQLLQKSDHLPLQLIRQ